MVGQEPRHEPDEFLGDVEDGTIGSHAEPLAGSGCDESTS